MKNIKSKYEKLSKKYKIPSFSELNENFDVERLDKETELPAREIRKAMMDKILGYIRFVEMMIHPSQAPPMFMVFVKNLTSEDRAVINQVYKSFVELELASLKLDVEYSEKSEITMINDIYNCWIANKQNLIAVIDVMERNWRSTSVKREKAYFG